MLDGYVIFVGQQYILILLNFRKYLITNHGTHRRHRNNYVDKNIEKRQAFLSALDQIDDRDYKAAFLEDDKPVIKLAIKFSSNTRNIESYEAVEEEI